MSIRQCGRSAQWREQARPRGDDPRLYTLFGNKAHIFRFANAGWRAQRATKEAMRAFIRAMLAQKENA